MNGEGNVNFRSSNVEVLRIISMIMIVVSHYTVHNQVINSTLPLGFNRFLLEITNLGNIGVIVFVLITGYFSVDKKTPFKLKKLVLLCLQVLFYSIIIYFVFIGLRIESFSIKAFIKNLFPLTFNKYWFITTYIVLYIFTPYINIFINSMNRKQYINFLVIGLFIFSILKMLTTQDYYGNELVQFLFFYAIGGYLKKYKDNWFSNSKNNRIVLMLTTLTLIFSVIIFDLIGTKISMFSAHSSYLFSRNSIVSILFSVSLLSVFISKKDYNNTFINGVASCVLGVYLVSDNNFVREVLWTKLLHVSNYVDSNFLVLHMICSVLLVFIACTIIEYVRKNTIGRVVSIIYDKIDNYIRKSKLYRILSFNKIL